MYMKLIACVQEQDGKWAIGNKNELLFHSKVAMKYFKNMTGSEIVLCGRKTAESFPNHQYLPNRINIVISHKLSEGETKHIKFDDGEVYYFNTLSQAQEFLETEEFLGKIIWVIGGSSIYEQLLPYCEEAYITKIHNQDIKEADSFIENLDKDECWKLTTHYFHSENNDNVEFCVYEQDFI